MLIESHENGTETSMFGFGYTLVNPVILSLVYSIIAVALGNVNAKDKLGMHQTVSILQKKINAMSKFMRMGIVALTVLFDWSGVLNSNKRFHNQCFRDRYKQIQQWKNSPIALCRNFMGFYHKMTLFIYYSVSTFLIEKNSKEANPLKKNY